MAALFSTFGIDWHLLLLQAINFGVLLIVLTWLLYKPVRNVLEKRRALVARGVEDAWAAEKALAEAAGKAALRVKGAEEEAEAILKSARTEAVAEKTGIVEDAQNRASQIEKDAAARAAESAARALSESEREIARLSMLAAEKVLRTKS